MSQGTIKRLTDKGFGFIENGTGTDMFFHMSACEGVRFEELREGQKSIEAGFERLEKLLRQSGAVPQDMVRFRQDDAAPPFELPPPSSQPGSSRRSRCPRPNSEYD